MNSNLEIIDKRNLLKTHKTKKYSLRAVSDIDTIAIHHSLTKFGSAEAFANYHVQTNDWPGIGYTFVIEIDGTVVWCNDIEKKTHHVGNSNKRAIGICLVGDFRNSEPNEKQVDALFKLIANLKKEYSIKIERILGHSELPGYDWKLCPCIDMDSIRTSFKSDEWYLKPKQIETKNFYSVKKGDSVWKIANDTANLTVKELLLLNPGINPTKLNIGQKIKLK